MGLRDMSFVDEYLWQASDADPVDEIEDEDGPIDTELYRLSERHRAAVENRLRQARRRK